MLNREVPIEVLPLPSPYEESDDENLFRKLAVLRAKTMDDLVFDMSRRRMDLDWTV